ncbi:hypothetical protein ACJMK2_041677 [Sinanodonta woodiana]|uniref:Uncharacterized protein n=1 Tax=Sinanodonta woodiana TaxID=1069815 RepID=A0ABD3W4X7_SINWO
MSGMLENSNLVVEHGTHSNANRKEVLGAKIVIVPLNTLYTKDNICNEVHDGGNLTWTEFDNTDYCESNFCFCSCTICSHCQQIGKGGT